MSVPNGLMTNFDALHALAQRRAISAGSAVRPSQQETAPFGRLVGLGLAWRRDGLVWLSSDGIDALAALGLPAGDA